MSGKLYITATPIGNLSDITLRALEVLKSVDAVACEDTRVTLKLLNHFDIKTSLISYHAHSGKIKEEKILELLLSGKDVALVTDAGTPGISDPGEKIIGEAVERGINVVPIPGPAAATTALSISGFNSPEYAFYGFLPHKKGRQTKLKDIADEKKTIVLYESPYRIVKLMDELLLYCGDRDICVFRELTKKFETQYRGKISEVKENIKPKGEFVVIMKGKHGKK